MSLIQKTGLLIGSLLIVGTCLAAGSPPPNVKEVAVTMANGQLTVTWPAVNDPSGIKFYRIYYSRASILGNNGNFDDFDQTPGPDTSYTFKSIPVKEGKIYIAVMAVNQTDTESEGFETEAYADIPATLAQPPLPSSEPELPPPASSVSPEPNTPSLPDQPMMIASVMPVSATGLLLMFTKPVATGVNIDPGYFQITDSGGTALPVNSVEITDRLVLLHTDPQQSNHDYQVALLTEIPATDGTKAVPGGPIPFKGYLQEPAFLASSPPASEPVTEPQVPYGKNPLIGTPSSVPGSPVPVYGKAPQGPPEDPSDLLFEALRQKNGLFNVVVRWIGSVDSRHTLNAYGLYTTHDGVTFEPNSSVGPQNTSVQFSRLPAGIFGVRVTAKDAQGNESPGIQKVVVLPASGIGLFGILAASGVLTSRIRRRNKKTAC